MAEPITNEQLVKASQNCETLDDVVNGDENSNVTSPDGRVYPTIAKALYEVIQTGGFEPFDTEAALLASVPTVPKKAAKALDTHKIWYWDGSSWTDTGLSELDQAKELVNQEQKERISETMFINEIIHDDQGNKYPLSVVTNLLQMMFGVSKNKFIWSSLELVKTNDGIIFQDASGRTLFKLDSKGLMLGQFRLSMGNNGLIITDKLGQTSAKLYPDGSWRIPKLKGFETQQLAQSVARLGFHKNAKIKCVLSIGQSLGVGTGSVDALSIVQQFSNVMFSGGVLSQQGESDYNATAFVPLIAKPSERLNNRSEPPVINATNALTRRLLEKYPTYQASDFQFFAQCCGTGGQSIEQLYSNGWINKLKQEITDLKILCDSLGFDLEVWAVLYIQGEDNYKTAEGDGRCNDTFTYMQEESSLIKDVTDHIAATTKQQGLPYFFNYQVGSHINYNPTSLEIAKAHWLLTKQLDQVSLFAPVYMMPTLPNDVHLPSIGSWLMGEYAARAIYHTMFLKQGKWRPLEPISVNWTDTYIDIEFYVPVKPIVLDNVLCTLTANLGFDIWLNGARQASAIASVSVLNSTTVRIQLNGAISDAKAEICYARGIPGVDGKAGPIVGARGNLRDSHGLYDTVNLPDSSGQFALHNACVMFSYNRLTGFN